MLLSQSVCAIAPLFAIGAYLHYYTYSIYAALAACRPCRLVPRLIWRFRWGQFRQDDVVRASSNFRRADHRPSVVTGYSISSTTTRRSNSHLATRQAAELLGYRVTAIDQIGSSHFWLRFDAPVQSSRNLVGGNSAAPPKGWQILPFLPLSG